MDDIKIKTKPISTIKKINKAKIGTQKLKENIVEIKERTNEAINEEDNINEYGTNKISNINNKIINNIENSTEKIGNRSVKESYNNAIKLKEKVDIYNRNKINIKLRNVKSDLVIRTKNNFKSNANKIVGKEIKTSNSNNIKLTKKQIKSMQDTIKKSEKATKKTIKASKKVERVTKEFINKSAKIIKTGTKVAIKVTKSIITALKGLISLIIAGGWISLIVIIIITLCMSVIAIFNRNGDEDTAQMWNSNIVNVAETQIGVTGGAPYWSWYGFNERVEWCACFVSWCADQCGLIENGSLPKFSACRNGIEWFKEKQKWANREGYIPKIGDIIFFDWKNKSDENQNGVSDHVGIVKSVDIENNKVYTIEGNSGDAVKERTYDINDVEIMGYGFY